MENFQQLVMYVFLVLLILALLVIGASLYKQKTSSVYPPVVAGCPDYWLASNTTKADGTISTTCKNVQAVGTCRGTTDMTKDVTGLTDCGKYTWATGCDINWEGISEQEKSTICPNGAIS